MWKGKITKLGSCPPPLRYEWTKAYPVRPKDNLTVHGSKLLSRPFHPTYEMEAEPRIDCLLDWSYGRQWQSEVTVFRANRNSLAASKRPRKKIPVYPPARPRLNSANAVRFTMKKFQNVSAKVQTRHTLRTSMSC